MDTIFLHGLKAETIIGIFDWERHTKQTLIIDLDMGTNIKKAALSDRIDDTLDYKSISKRIVNFVEDSSFQLVETLTEQIAAILLEEFHINWVRVKVNKKGAVSLASDVGVIIERSRPSA
jgi:7,8-dihydroneopterin aldolase/epimerase/oxygenase